MKELISSHGAQATIVLFVVLFNIILTAVKTGIEKIEDFLAPTPGAPVDPNSKLEKVKALVVKLLGWTQTIIDWVTGNKEH